MENNKNTDKNSKHLQCEFIDIKKLSKFQKNSRKHSKHQIEQIKNSIKEFGFTNPIITDENLIILAGHARYEAAKKLELTKIPCIVLSNLDELQKRAYVIADNKLALNASWDLELLTQEVSDLLDADYDVELIGFDADELNALIQQNEDEIIQAKEKEYKSVYEVIIVCDSETDQQKLYDRMTKEGRECRVLSI